MPDLTAASRRALAMARLERLWAVMAAMDVPALLTIDPIAILYATGARNMTIFGLMSGSRYALVLAGGPVVLFEHAGCGHLAEGLATVDEVRPATAVSAVAAGAAVEDAARTFAREIAAIVRAHLGPRARLGVERLHFMAVDALRAEGLVLCEGGRVFAEARRVKLGPEIAAMREAVARVEAAAARLAARIEPGRTEAEVWAELHAGLIAGEGEYISTRLLQSGPRTFPYFQECGARRLAAGDLVALDTDAIGYLGYAVDFSRTFLAGDGRPTGRQKTLHRLAFEQLQHNAALFVPGRSFAEIAAAAWPVPQAFRPHGYYCIAHGLGMSGEHPNVPHRDPGGGPYPLEGALVPGMVMCVESYVGSPQDGEGVKLEDQLLITTTGAERLTTFPFDDRLLERQL